MQACRIHKKLVWPTVQLQDKGVNLNVGNTVWYSLTAQLPLLHWQLALLQMDTMNRNISIQSFGRPFVKRFALCYGAVVCPVLSCLSVTLVYCDQTVGWIKMKLSMEVGSRPWSHCVRRGPIYPTHKRGTAPNFQPMSIVAKRSPVSATAVLSTCRPDPPEFAKISTRPDLTRLDPWVDPTRGQHWARDWISHSPSIQQSIS